MVDLRQTKLSQYTTTEQLLCALAIIKDGSGVCNCSLENIRLFGFGLNLCTFIASFSNTMMVSVQGKYNFK